MSYTTADTNEPETLTGQVAERVRNVARLLGDVAGLLLALLALGFGTMIAAGLVLTEYPEAGTLVIFAWIGVLFIAAPRVYDRMFGHRIER